MSKGTVLITGASSEIGRALLPLIDTRKYNVLATRNESSEPFNQNVEDVLFDASCPFGIEKFLERIKDAPVSYFIQLQGNSLKNDFLTNQTLERLDFHLRVNSISSILCLSQILPFMVKQKFGKVLLMNTASSEHGGGESSFGYGLAKHSISFLAKHTAKYYGKHGVIANCISPGFIETDFHKKRMSRSEEEILKRGQSVRLGRPGTPEELASFIEYIVFKNNFISGQNIKFDGADFI